MLLNFKTTKPEKTYIDQIVERAIDMFGDEAWFDRKDIVMDVTATHCNGAPFHLTALRDCDDFTFAHDILGIRNHLDRQTGELQNFFLPRTSAPFRYPYTAISIRQPWAHHILFNGKPVENRSRRTNYRGYILIHAGLTVEDKEYVEKHDVPYGGIVGMVEIVDCVEKLDSPWFRGPFGWVLANPTPLEFLPCKGKQGFFIPDIDFTKLRPSTAPKSD